MTVRHFVKTDVKEDALEAVPVLVLKHVQRTVLLLAGIPVPRRAKLRHHNTVLTALTTVHPRVQKHVPIAVRRKHRKTVLTALIIVIPVAQLPVLMLVKGRRRNIVLIVQLTVLQHVLKNVQTPARLKHNKAVQTVLSNAVVNVITNVHTIAVGSVQCRAEDIAKANVVETVG